MMIRTHRPRGNAFSCASRFQESKQYRAIDYEDVAAIQEDILISDSDDDLTLSERASKRRRIRTLADDFVNGRPLYVFSATSDAPSFWEAIRRTSRERKQPWQCDVDDLSANGIWDDVKDEWEILRQHSSHPSGLPNRRYSSKPQSTNSDLFHDHTPSENHSALPRPDRAAEKIGKPSRRRPTVQPSSPAMRRKAALRNRTTNLMAPRPMETITERTELSSLPLSPQTFNRPQATTDMGARNQSTLTSTQRPNPSPSFKGPVTPMDNTMADELRCSRTESTSRRPKPFEHQDTSFMDSSTAETVGGITQFFSLSGKESPAVSMTGEVNPEQGADGDGFLLQNEGQLGRVTSSAKISQYPRQLFNQDHSSAQIDHAAITNDKSHIEGHSFSSESNHASGQPSSHNLFSQRSTTLQQMPLTSSFSIRKPLQRTVSDTDAEKFVQASSNGGNGPERIMSISSENSPKLLQHRGQSCNTGTPQVQRDPSKQIPVATVKSDLTPFKYSRRNGRRVHRTSPRGLDPQEPGETGHHQITANMQHQSEQSQYEGMTPQTGNTLEENVHPPSALEMRLSNELLNRDWPTSPVSRAFKDPTRKDRGACDARMSRIDDASTPTSKAQNLEDALQSSDEHHVQTSAVHATASTHLTVSPQWPGTQALLQQAQQDLLISPQKTPAVTPRRSEGIPVGPDTQGKSQHPEPIGGSNVQVLHQDDLPGTQSLIEQWSPWSTVRKPKTGKRTSFAPSPTIMRGTTNYDSPDSQRSERARRSRRRSSLRQSMIAAESSCSQPGKSTSAALESGVIKPDGQTGHDIRIHEHASQGTPTHESSTQQGDSTTLVEDLYVKAPLEVGTNTMFSHLGDNTNEHQAPKEAASFMGQENETLDNIVAGLATEVFAGTP